LREALPILPASFCGPAMTATHNALEAQLPSLQQMNEHALSLAWGSGRAFGQVLVVSSLAHSWNPPPADRMRETRIALSSPGWLGAVHCSLEQLPFSDSVFSYVVMQHVLEFSRSPLEVLAEACRVLDDRGELLLTVVDPRSILVEKMLPDAVAQLTQAELTNTKEWARMLRHLVMQEIQIQQWLLEPNWLQRHWKTPPKPVARVIRSVVPSSASVFFIHAKRTGVRGVLLQKRKVKAALIGGPLIAGSIWRGPST
jgi:SAM-dependent methyltransferase